MKNSMFEAIDSFKSSMLDHGIVPPTNIIGDSKLHRFYVDGDKKGTLNGAYTLHLDSRPSGWFMHFRTGISATWTLSGKSEPLTADVATLNRTHSLKYLQEGVSINGSRKTESLYG